MREELSTKILKNNSELMAIFKKEEKSYNLSAIKLEKKLYLF